LCHKPEFVYARHEVVLEHSSCEDRDLASASCQPSSNSARLASPSEGSKGWRWRGSASSSASEFHCPTARPASHAAPRAERSAEELRNTGQSRRFDWNCISMSLRLAPPSARSAGKLMPA